MAARSIGRVLVLLAIIQFLGGCGSPDPSPASPAGSTTDLDRLGHAISAAAGYPPDTVDLTGNRLRLQITISDVKLAQSDENARTAAASALVALVEQSQPAYPGLLELQVISVSMLHRSGAEESPNAVESPKKWHAEDVIEFRRGQSQRFVIHMS